MSRFNLNQPIPLLILGDGADQKTGLGRLGHDLAWLLSSMPEFKVGYLGRCVTGKASFPWASYAFGVQDQWGEMKIEDAWNDLSQGVKGIILTLWDASRLTWFADPTGLPKKLTEFLTGGGKFERWGYFMQDAAGVDPERLPMECAEVFARYDRVLLASQWAHQLTQRSVKLSDVDWIPHGINTKGFDDFTIGGHPAREIIRGVWNAKDEPIIGCVMSNTARKQWPVVFEAVARMPGYPRLWIHTDRLVNYWNLNALAVEYGLTGERVIYEPVQLTDQGLAFRYRACDATVVISGGEGFCYPVAESLACGVPALTGSYGAAAEIASSLVHPVTSVVDTSHNVRRAVYSGKDVAHRLQEIIETKKDPEHYQAYVKHLDWNLLGSVWQKWFRKGLQ